MNDRKPLPPIYKAQELYGNIMYDRPKYVPDGHCLWCGKPIENKRRKCFCSDECSKELNRLIMWGHHRGGYSTRIVWRDNITCQDCGKFMAYQNEHGVFIPVDRGAEVHHIIPVGMGGSDAPDNLITLCHDCHKNRHRKLNRRQ